MFAQMEESVKMVIFNLSAN